MIDRDSTVYTSILGMKPYRKCNRTKNYDETLYAACCGQVLPNAVC
jgi:hypothetical protein